MGPLLVGHDHLITQAGGLVTADGAVVNLHGGETADLLPTLSNRRVKVDYLSTGRCPPTKHWPQVPGLDEDIGVAGHSLPCQQRSPAVNARTTAIADSRRLLID